MRLHVLLVSLLALRSVLAAAEVYPERGNTEISLLDGADADFQARLEAIRAAKISIDLISFSQAPDAIGRPFLDAIRSVQQSRCVKVRALYDGVASWLDWDFFNRSGRLLATGTKCPGEVVTFDLFEKWKSGFEWDDFFHEKVLIVDGGTRDEKIFIGGRGYTRFSTLIADSGFLVRPIDPFVPSLGTDLRASFLQLWTLAKHLSPPLARRPTADFEDEGKAPAELPPGSPRPGPAAEFRPKSARLFSNDLALQIAKHSAERGPTDRAFLRNDAQAGLIAAIDGFAGTLAVTSYAVGFPDDLLAALARFVKRGNSLEIYTNGKAANAKFIPGGVPVYYSAEVLTRLFDAVPGAEARISVFFLEGDAALRRGRPAFVHRKLAVFTNAKEGFVFTGSDNFTWSSAKKNDEWMIRIDDLRLAEALRKRTAAEAVDYQKLSAAEIRALYGERTFLYGWLRPFIYRNY